MVVHCAVQLLRFMLQEEGIQIRVVCHTAQGGVKDVAQVVKVITHHATAGDELLALAHLLGELILQSGALHASKAHQSRKQLRTKTCEEGLTCSSRPFTRCL